MICFRGSSEGGGEGLSRCDARTLELLVKQRHWVRDPEPWCGPKGADVDPAQPGMPTSGLDALVREGLDEAWPTG